ncbi:hypothetical protein LVJ82_10835 [Vitreoscilla massiliensis]|uniref:Uncharacterized protein n=1 Tax=Vitreoscilla massiliensis TaxID=1689272 RepID=A0ABY4DY22_9NEIS|nr:hypothetical protein [Vitreoscilla massiliensis]UOO87988.1 hypothetical protein LVJ82_10835 [Vitreoscilla massiliensis]
MNAEQQFANELARISQETEAALQDIQRCAHEYQQAVGKIEQISSAGAAALLELLKTLPNPSELVVDVSEIFPIKALNLADFALPDLSELQQLATSDVEVQE